MGNYNFTKAAAADFENIFDFGIDTVGLEQALAYQNGLKQRFDELGEQPELYPAVEHLRKGYRRSLYGSHAIHYRMEGSGVVIVRILGQQNQRKSILVYSNPVIPEGVGLAFGEFSKLSP